jgi:hypothetical protein
MDTFWPNSFFTIAKVIVVFLDIRDKRLRHLIGIHFCLAGDVLQALAHIIDALSHDMRVDRGHIRRP